MLIHSRFHTPHLVGKPRKKIAAPALFKQEELASLKKKNQQLQAGGPLTDWLSVSDFAFLYGMMMQIQQMFEWG